MSLLRFGENRPKTLPAHAKETQSMTGRLLCIALATVAAIAPVSVAVAQSDPHGEKRRESWEMLQPWVIDVVLEQFGPDAHVAIFPHRVVVRSGDSIELICEDSHMELTDHANATRDLYPVSRGFCETLVQAFERRRAAGRQ
jgi:hypothetical protein